MSANPVAQQDVAGSDDNEEATFIFNAFRGHGSPRKSRKIVLQGNPDVYNRIKIRELRTSLKEASDERRTSRLRAGRLARNPLLVKAHCAGRASQQVEFSRLNENSFLYPAARILGKPERVYTLWVGWQPFASFTDSMEAFRSCIAMQQLGYDADVR